MNKKDTIYLIIILALILIFITAYVQKPTNIGGIIYSNSTECVNQARDINLIIPDNIMDICRSKADQYYDLLKPHSCKDNNLGVAYSLRVDSTGDAGTNYYLIDGSFFYNCGAYLAETPEGYEEKCAQIRNLECNDLVEC